MNPNKRPPPSSVGSFEGGDGLRDATKRPRDFPDGKILRPGQEQPGNVLLLRITDIVHPVTILALQQIFSRFGKVDKIVMFDKGSGFQALVQMSDVYSAMNAHEAADMQEMYSGCNLIRVGYSNLQNVTVKSNTERSWDFNIGPPLEGALPPGKSPSNTKGGKSADVVGDYRYPSEGASTPPATRGSVSSSPSRPSPARSYSSQQYSPYSAVQQQQLPPSPYTVPQQQQQQPHQQEQQQQQQQQTYPSQLVQPHAYGSPPSPAQSVYPTSHHQHVYGDGVGGHYGPSPTGGMAGGGGGSYASQSYGQQEYAGQSYGQGTPPPYSQPHFNSHPYGQNYPPRGSHRGGGDDNIGINGAGGGGGGPGGYPRPPPQPPGSYYQPSPNVIPPHGGPYGSIPFSERGPNGFGSMAMGASRPMSHSVGPVMGSVGGTGVGTLGVAAAVGRAGGGILGMGLGYGGRGGGQGPRGTGGGSLSGGALLQTPMHRPMPSVAYDNGAYRPPMRFRSSDKTSGGAVSGGEIKPGYRAPRLDPLHIQALSAPVSKKSAKNRNQDGEVVDEADKKAKASADATASALAAAVAAIKQRTANGGGRKAVPLSAEELSAAAGSRKVKAGVAKNGSSKGSGEGGGKKANKREAAEMLGPDTTDQLAAATAKVRVSDVVEEDGEGKRANKREAAEMLGLDAADQLAAATAKVRVSDDNENGDDSGTKGDGTSASAASGEKPGSVEQGGEIEKEEREAVSSAGGNSKDTGGGEPATLGENGKRGEGTDGGRPSSGEEPGLKKVKGVKASGDDGKNTVEKRVGKTGICSVTGEGEGTDGEGTGVEREGKVNGESSRDGIKAFTVPSDPSDAESKAGGQGAKVNEELEEESGDVKAEKSQATEDNDNDNDNEDDVSPGVGEEAVDVGAWSIAAPASRSPILMVRNVNSEEVTPGALCQLFGLYGDVMKVKLVTSRGMALVEMRYAIQAINAQRLIDQIILCGMVLEVKASNQWTINDPTATNYSEYQGVQRYKSATSPEDSRYRDSLSSPCPTLVVDNLSLDVSVEEITAVFAKHGAVSSVDLNTTAAAVPDASTGNSDPKPSVQALVHMEADGRIGATEAAIHALVMTHNLMQHGRRLRVSFLSGERHIEK